MEIKNLVIAAAHTEMGYFHNRVVSAATALPWSLSVGDVGANLAQLAAGPEPKEPTASKIHKLMVLGYNTEQLCDAVKLLGECPWSTLVCEQLHGSVATTLKFHPDFDNASLVLTSIAHSMRRILPGPSQDEKRVNKFRRELNKILAKMPQRTHAKQMYYRDIVNVAMEKVGPDQKLSRSARTKIMKNHSRVFESLSAQRKAAYSRAAEVHKSERWAERDKDIEHARCKFEAAQVELERAAQLNPDLRLTACKWGPDDEVKLQSIHDVPSFDADAVAKLRDESVIPPPPDHAHKAELMSCP